MRTPEPPDIPVFILCGGMGTRLGEGTAGPPKPMVDIGGRPMLLHVMAWYGRFGFRRFVLCTGFRSEVIGAYFLDFAAHSSDFTVELARRSVTYHQRERVPDWEVTVAFTGVRTMTGGRLARAAERYLGDAPHFARHLRRRPDGRRTWPRSWPTTSATSRSRRRSPSTRPRPSAASSCRRTRPRASSRSRARPRSG